MRGFFNKDNHIKNIFSSSTGKLLLLNLKSIYSTTSTRVVIIFSPILVAFALAVMFPIWMAVPAGQVFVVPLSSGVVYAMSYYPLKNSTFDKNLQITRIKKVSIYSAILFSMFIITFQSEMSYWTTVISMNLMNKKGWIPFGGLDWILTDLIPRKLKGLIPTPFVGSSVYSVDWQKVEWAAVLYYWIVSTLLMFVGSFAFRNLCKTQKTYYLILIVYIFSLVGFGNLLPTYYRGVDGNIVKDGLSPVNNKDLRFSTPMGAYIISCIIPQYHLNVFLMKSMDSGIINTNLVAHYSSTWWNLGSVSAFSWSSDWHWNLSLLYPVATFFVLTLVSIATIDKW